MTGAKIITIPNLSSWLLVVWGGFCVNPYSNLFDKNPHLYMPMVSLVGSEVFWGSFFGLTGILGLALAAFGKSRVTALLMSQSYMLFASLYLLGDYTAPGWMFFGSIALANLLIWGALRWSLKV